MSIGTLTAAVSHNEPVVEMLAGRPEVAEARLRGGYERLEAMGERAVLATTAALLARARRVVTTSKRVKLPQAVQR